MIVKEAAPGGLEEEVVEQEVLEEEDATPEIEIVHPWGHWWLEELWAELEKLVEEVQAEEPEAVGAWRIILT